MSEHDAGGDEAQGAFCQMVGAAVGLRRLGGELVDDPAEADTASIADLCRVYLGAYGRYMAALTPPQGEPDPGQQDPREAPPAAPGDGKPCHLCGVHPRWDHRRAALVAEHSPLCAFGGPIPGAMMGVGT